MINRRRVPLLQTLKSQANPRILNVPSRRTTTCLACEKFKSMNVNERREQFLNFRLCFNCLRPGHMSKDCKSRTCSAPSCGRRHNRLLHSDLPKNETTKKILDATTVVATNITKAGLPVVQIKLTNRDLSLNVLAMCNSGSLMSFVILSPLRPLTPKNSCTILSPLEALTPKNSYTIFSPLAALLLHLFTPLNKLPPHSYTILTPLPGSSALTSIYPL